MKCPRCGEETGEFGGFCQECGHKILQVGQSSSHQQKQCRPGGESSQPAAMKCPACGEETGESSRFCQECGRKIKQADQQQPQQQWVVVCSGQLEDGSPCREELRARQRFCPSCGIKVDQALFKVDTEQGQGHSLPPSLDDGKGSSAEGGKDIITATYQQTVVQKTIVQTVTHSSPPADESMAEASTDHNTAQPEEIPADSENGEEAKQFDDKERNSELESSGNLKIFAENCSSSKDSDASEVCGTSDAVTGECESGKSDGDSTSGIKGKIKVFDESDKSANKSKISDDVKEAEISGETSGTSESCMSGEAQEHSQNEAEILAGKSSLITSTDFDNTQNDKDLAKEVLDKAEEENKSSEREVLKDDKSTTTTEEVQNGTDLTGTAGRITEEEDYNTAEENKDDEDAYMPANDSTGSPPTSGYVFGDGKEQEKPTSVCAPGTTSRVSLFSLGNNTTASQNVEGTNVDAPESVEGGMGHSKEKRGLEPKVSAEGTSVDDEASDSDKDSSVGDGLSRRQKRNLRKRQKQQTGTGAMAQIDDARGKKGGNKDQSGASQKNSQKNQGAGSSGQKQTSSNINTRSQTEKTVTVYFHAVVSEQFKLEEKDKQLVIRSQDLLGHWQIDEVFPKHGNNLDMVKSIAIPRSKIINGAKIQYKYCIKGRDKDGSPSYKWEYYKNTQSGSPNRTLFIPPKWKDRDEWHQYDGYIEREPDFLSKVKNTFTSSEFAQHAKDSVEIFASNILKKMRGDFYIQEGLDHLDMMMTCLRRVYFSESRYWTYDRDFKKVVGESLVSTLLDLLGKSSQGEATEAETQTEKRIVMSLATVYMMKTLDVTMPEKSTQSLFEALIIKPNTETKECQELKIAEKYFKRKELKAAFIYMARKLVEQSKNPSWLYIMPWIHFLSDVKPYQPLEVDLNHDSAKPVWWGTGNLVEDVVTNFVKHYGQWEISLETVLEKILPLYEIDFLLPRTFMTTVELKFFDKAIKTKKIPMEVCIASLVYHLRVTRPRYVPVYGFGYETSDEKTVVECATSILEELQAFFSEEENKARWEMCYRFSATLLHESTKTDRNVTMYLCAQIAAHCLAMYHKTETQGSPGAKSCVPEVKHLTGMIVQWLYFYTNRWDYYMEDNLKVWDQTFAPVECQSEHVRDAWNEEMTNAIRQTLNREVGSEHNKTSKLIKLYCEKTENYHPVMQECLSQMAFKTISNGYTIDYGGMNRDGMKRFGELLSNMFNTAWNKALENAGNRDSSSNEERILSHVLRWKHFLHFLKIRDKDQGKLQLFSQVCTDRMVLAVSVIEMVVSSLTDGSITIDTLSLISVPENRFDEIAEHVMQEKKQTREFFLKAIAVRTKEIEAFNVQAAYMVTFTNLCEHVGNVDRRAVDQTLEKQRCIGSHYLKEFCEPAPIHSVEDVKAYKPRLCAFHVRPPVLAILPVLHRCNDSSTFLSLWQQISKTVGDKPVTLEDVVERVWKPVKQTWDTVAGDIHTGEITFQLMEKLIGHLYREDYDTMLGELGHMNIQQQRATERLKQLQQYRHLEMCVGGAKVILDFARKYGLQGDFEDIKTIASHGQNELKMRFFDENLMKTCKVLGDLTPDKAKCLDKFVQCEPLVKWLQESMHTTGLKELKVFVDLAFMSAGEEPMNVKRVQCLHSAVTGYAPLIFDLKPKADYRDLLAKCELVWVELKANPALPKQLIDTNRQLEWLKDVKKAHGSVEVTSLVQAEAINACGIYTVGSGAWKKRAGMEGMAGLMQVLQLTVSEVEGKRQQRNYNHSQLQDLQSRLMLVAGKKEKGSEGVENFTSVFDSIVRLSKVYLQLCSAGCVLFKEWTARFLCDLKRPVCAILEFGDSKDTPHLKGRRNKEEDLKEVIPQLANFMETCYEDWLRYIKEKRQEYLHLNFFTVDQLVILQRELVKCGTEEQPSHLVYPLLSAVKQHCTPGDLVSAMAEAKASLETAEMEQEAETDEETEDIPEETTDAQLRQTFVEDIVQAGYDRALAERALEFVSVDDVDAGIIWCMDHADDAEMGEDGEVAGRGGAQEGEPGGATAGTAETPMFQGWNSSSNSSIQNLIASNIKNINTQTQSGDGFGPLHEDLRLLWKEFLGSITSNVKDYLSLEHLGLILRFLAQRNKFHVDRSLPPGYKEGDPNLLICPSADVLPMVLSIYMMTKKQPLPQPDEVLVCTPQTTVDEVDIFWKRALFGDVRKLHCLANVDLLDYDVSDAAERYLEEYRQSGTAEARYKLVVLCGSDNENRSRIVSSLDKCRRVALPINLAGIQTYLADKLRVHNLLEGGINPAAAVDFSLSSVRLVKSWRAGVGKTLYKTRTEAALAGLNPRHVRCDSVSIPLQEKAIDLHYMMERLLEHSPHPGQCRPTIFHIDVAHEVQSGVDYLLFNLLVLGCVTDKTGYVWRKSEADLYLIETMPLMVQANTQKAGEMQYVHKMLSILPDVTCRSPMESLAIYNGRPPKDYKDSDQLFDEGQFGSPVFQRPFQYLWRNDQGQRLEGIDPYTVAADPPTCLQTLLRHCGVQDPSWAELHHFVWFLNTQLQDYETNNFVGPAAAEDLPGFAKFVLRFLINMSRDFSNRSLNMSEQSPGVLYEHQQLARDEEDLEQYQMRRTWESSPHPYLFINDGSTFTFLGFNIDRATGNMVDQQTGEILEPAIMTQNLYDSLVRQFVPIRENFDALPRDQKILKLCSVMGAEMPHDPDDTYELTTDNVKKIMAIYMRFRCDIPVIIMGETGCGKTRLVKFMCSLQMPPGVEATNMILMKVHGGTTNEDIKKKVRQAEQVAKTNLEMFGRRVFTILFFDEANTTEAIGLIKEIMCDKTLEGKKLRLCENLKIVAACNPYRKHSVELIEKLEQAGLGYHVDAEDTGDRLGRVPMRRLVYRVQPLPQSLLPLVWDFGQLNTQVEDLYIRQMVRRYVRDGVLPVEGLPGFIEVVSRILTASQDYMRQQKDECSFVSLRDVDRVLSVMGWFYQQSQDTRTLFDLMDMKDDEFWEEEEGEEEDEDEDEDEGDIREERPTRMTNLDDITRSLVLALGVCYHACLKDRTQYRMHVTEFFTAPCALPGGAETMDRVINTCQDVFLDCVQLEKNIARNQALRENVFMMAVCIELRIPLFLVGKPGSSKSLAKTIVSDAMQGNASRDDLFKELKQAQMVSFQCSPLATPDGIVGTFRQCAQFQKDKDLGTFVSIVVLDEVGLAEDSPRMPLKTLHPLLEDGCQGDEKPEKHKKVAFIGISNWALDPAKMNRGILVQREVPDLEELENSARGICDNDESQNVLARIEPLIKPMARSYLAIFNQASQERREFYGLRDFYSLVKMVYAFTERSRRDPTWHEMKHAVLRNFGGLEQVNPVASFRKHLARVKHLDNERRISDPDCTPKGLIEACLFDTNKMQSESRYLLLLTENYGALNILQQEILARQTAIRPITIFGSSFRSDQEYTQVCRNINKIKVCMETGNTVVLLNLENLYESLYDALNQYYVYFGGERYVDLGLGTHRVKCPVHKNFRLIVVAEKQTVYAKFPIPLINRLEKHFLTLGNMLSPDQQALVTKLEEWAENFVKQNTAPQHIRAEKSQGSKVGDVFMGYHDDTCAAIVIHVWPANARNLDDRAVEDIMSQCKQLLLWVATPDAVVRLSKSGLVPQEQARMKQVYNERQAHDSIAQYLQQAIITEQRKQLFAQVTTHSKLLPSGHCEELSRATEIPTGRILLLDTLSSFDTEQQFSNKIQQFLKQQREGGAGLLVVQCDSGDRNAGLVACARYCVMDEFESAREELQGPVHVVFIIQLPRIAGGCFTGFQCGVWHSVHIDDLRACDADLPTVQDMEGKSVATLLESAVGQPEPMDTSEPVGSPMAQNGAEGMEWEQSERMPELEPANYAMGEPAPSTSYEAPPDAINIEDVVVSLERVGTRGQQGEPRGPPRKNLNVQSLILACVQAALSMVKDKQENTARTTDRVPLVLKLFHQDTGRQSFLHGVCHFIAMLLKDKESSAYTANQWLIDEAAKYENIHKAGTFRRSCLQTLEAKISPILAGIIAYLDINQNLDILQDNRSPWRYDLWLNILNTPKAIPLKYSDLQSPKRKSDLPEVIVMTTGCDDQLFQGQMPFSWLVYAQLDEVIDKTQLPHEDGEEVSMDQKVELYVGVLTKSKIGGLLEQVKEYEAVMDAVQMYVEDFVHMVYKVSTPQEHTLVCQSVMYVTNQLSEQLPEGGLLYRLVCVHLAYQFLEPRLVYFHTMNCVWPECSQQIITLKEQNPESDMFKEEEFTFSALCLLIQDLTPPKNALNEAEKRSQWLQKVYKYRQVAEKVIRLHTEDPGRYGSHSQDAVTRASCLWSRVVAVKLFLEHVCTSEDKDAITIKHCMPLWALLKDKADLKELKSLENVEKFLKSCNKSAIKEFMGTPEVCCLCEVELEGPPVMLPCKHIMCDNCLHDIQALGDVICPSCKKTVKKDWNPVRQTEKHQASKKLQDYQKRCNSFFMDIVSQLCFADNTPPSEAVVEKLLKYVLVARQPQGDAPRRLATKEMSIFDTGIDPTPVFRSFLLQLMMRTNREMVERYLVRYLKEAEMFIARDADQRDSHYISLSLLIIQCFEDILLKESSSTVGEDVRVGMGYLRNARHVIDTDQLTVEKLCGLAEARIGLAITAKYMADIVNRGQQAMIEPGVRRLIADAQTLCTELRCTMPRTYLVKYLCRRYGMDTYQAVCKSQQHYLRWTAMTDLEANERVECADRYVVCGEVYTRIREALTKVIIGEDVGHLDATLQGLMEDQGHLEVMLQLAVHREISNSNLYPPARRKVKQEMIQKVDDYIMQCNLVKNKPLIQALLGNQLGGNHLVVQQGANLRLQGVQCLVVHFLSVVDKIKGEGTLMNPLVCLMKTPQALQNAFLPTMPQDDLDEVKEALLAARNTPAGAGENPIFYRCPNGHPYVIGNCGRPAYQDTCKTCGQQIGGQGYTLAAGNIQDVGTDQTMTGHILGWAATRGQGPRPERALTPLHCACVRLLTHLAMYAGTLANAQGVEALIKPDLTPGSGSEFLWQHIMLDIDDLQRGVGKSVDDVLLLMHAVIQTIMTQQPGGNTRPDIAQLSSKKGRTDWEQQISMKYLKPVLQNIDVTLKDSNQRILQDQRLGADPLLCLLYETENQQDPVHPGLLQEAASVWRYRTPISLDHLRQEFDAKMANLTAGQRKKQHKVLQHFLKEDHHMRAIRYIPSILKLHRVLLGKYLRRLDKEEGSAIQIADLKRDETCQGIECLVDDFAAAWELLREDLKMYACPTELGPMVVPKQYCSQGITDELPVAFLLPTTKDRGLCSYALLDLLMRKQNHFLTEYMKATDRSKDIVTMVAPKDITTAHLISYDPDQDILPLVLANCKYSFEMGKGTSIDYDFLGLERQLMDRFLFSKSRINIEETLKIDLMVYRAEVTNALVFKKLGEKIPQEVLSGAVKSQISCEIRSLPELCTSLDNLDIAISFLTSVGGDPRQNLYDFMAGTLKMENSLTSQKARQECQFQHAQSLWLHLSLLKSKQIADHHQSRQSMFDNIEDKYYDNLEKAELTSFRDYMKQLSVDKLSQLVEVLHEYIVLEVSVRDNMEDEDYVDKATKQLSGWLFGYLDILERPNLDLGMLDDFPKEIQIRHSSHAWVEAYRMLNQKRTGQRH